MKFVPVPAQGKDRRHRAGWSLVELLFVMAIMIGLASLMAASIGPIQANVARQRTKGLMKMLGTGLSQFHAEYGTYPKCQDMNQGASVLYRTMFGDYDDSGKPDWVTGEANQDAAVKTFVPDLNPGTQADGSKARPDGTTMSGWVSLDAASNTFRIVDSWGTQIFYVSGKDASGNLYTKHNSTTFDLWSLGNDPDPSDANQSMWIKNW